MDEEWKPIPYFPGYSVSNLGRVRNDETGRMMALLKNQTGVVNVGLTYGQVQHKRSVALLVARAFLPSAITEFDTPIHLDGDSTNNRVDNLMWRPRWYANMYKNQFKRRRGGYKRPIRDISSREVFPTSWEAATRFGLLEKEIVLAIQNRTFVWPTYQRFELVEE